MKRTTLLTTLSVILFTNIILAQVDTTPMILNANLENTPQNINASDGTFEKYILINWDLMAGNKNYHIYRSTSEMEDSRKEIEVSKRKSITNNAIFDYNVSPGVFYNYWIVGTDKNGVMTSFSELDEGHIPAKKIYATPPTLLSDVKQDSILFKWLPISGAKQYRLQMTKAEDYQWTSISGFDSIHIEIDTMVTGTTFLIQQPKADSRYYYTLQAVDGEEQSFFSDVSATLYTKNQEMIMFSPYMPDIRISDFKPHKADGKLSLNFQLSNNDTTTFEDFQLLYFISEDEQYDSEDVIIATQYIDFLDEEKSLELKQILPDHLNRNIGIAIFKNNEVSVLKMIAPQ